MSTSSMRLPGMGGSVPTIGASAPAQSPSASPSATGPTGPVEAVVAVTEASFEAEVVQRSMQVPVVLDFWADWCEPCKQLGPVLEKLAREAGGTWVLATIDVDANPRIAEAAQVQGIPAVKAVLRGQVVDLFTGAVSEAQAREVLDKVVELAQREGLTGGGEAAPTPPPLDPDLLRGDDAFAAGDFDAAQAAYEALVSREPANHDAKSSLARLAVVRRASAIDQDQLQADIAADPTALSNVMTLADILVLSDRLEDAFDGLLNALRASSGDDKDMLRARLLELFLAVGDDDPAVVIARRALASALF